MMWLILLLACKPGLPELPDDTSDDDDDTGDTAVIDTAPPPPCAQPEAEPNNVAGEATPLALEVTSCGVFEAAGDADFWTFVLEEDSWVELEVEAASIGSFADAALFVTADGLTVSSFGNLVDETRDPRLVAPLPAGTYSMNLFEENLQGGEEFRYEALVSEVKPPLDWTRAEVEPSETLAQAQLIADGESAFGKHGSATDTDWYRIEVPEGRHQLTVRVHSVGYGGANDTTLRLRTAEDQVPDGCSGGCVFERGEVGYELDPVANYLDPSGGEPLFVEVRHAAGETGTTAWYVVDVTLEAQ